MNLPANYYVLVPSIIKLPSSGIYFYTIPHNDLSFPACY